MDLRQHVAQRLKQARAERDWSLDALAERSGVSRAMLSKIERGVSVPTTLLLARIGDALGLSLSALMRPPALAGQRLTRLADQPQWTDTACGYTRRVVSAAAYDGDVDLVAIELPPGATVSFPAAGSLELEGKLLLLQGRLTVTADTPAATLTTTVTTAHTTTHTTTLAPGDCLRVSLHRAHTLHNPGDDAARYLVVTRPSPVAGG